MLHSVKTTVISLLCLLPLCSAELHPIEANIVGPEGQPAAEVGDIRPTGIKAEEGLNEPRDHQRPRGPIGVPETAGAYVLSDVVRRRGRPGDTELSEDELSRFVSNVTSEVLGQVMKKVAEALEVIGAADNRITEFEEKLSALSESVTGRQSMQYSQPFRSLCGIASPNWRRVAYIDTTQGPGQCPSGLVEHVNSTTNQRACGRSTDEGCSSVTYPTGNYTNICGRVRGYQFYSANAFEQLQGSSINDPYVDGVSITRGSPRQHVWSYAAYHCEGNYDTCPCGQASWTDVWAVPPTLVHMDYYCETAFGKNSKSDRIAWENPLWDGAGSSCGYEGQCCATFGWFHKTVSPSTSDNIEVRWCADQDRGNEDVLTDLVEIWVM